MYEYYTARIIASGSATTSSTIDIVTTGTQNFRKITKMHLRHNNIIDAG